MSEPSGDMRWHEIGSESLDTVSRLLGEALLMAQPGQLYDRLHRAMGWLPNVRMSLDALAASAAERSETT